MTLSTALLSEENMFRGYEYNPTNGFGNLKILHGDISRDEIHGDYIRYTHNDCDIYVVMGSGGSTVILNGADDAKTCEIYNNIRRTDGKIISVNIFPNCFYFFKMVYTKLM